MTNYNIEADNLLLDFDSFSQTGIELNSEQINRAVELSDRIINPERQWKTYLNSLALFGFETWLEERDSSLTINSYNCSVKRSSYANYIDGVFNLTVGEYKICLLTNGVAIDEFITIDRAVIDLPEYASHLYVLVNVVEEQAEVNIDRFIPYDQIIQRRETANITAAEDWTYEIPLAWFNSQPDDILLYLRCLPNTITLPTAATPTENIPNQLEPLIAQLQSGEALHQILTWSQAAFILSNSHLLNWLYELQTTQSSVEDSLVSLSNASKVAKTAINVKSWLSNELDRLAQSLSWTLLPPPAFASSGLRDLEVVSRESLPEEFAAIITQLRSTGEDIPEDARGACQDFNLANHALRLFAVIWTVEETEGVREWGLLLVLGAQPDSYLPQGLKLELKESETILDEKIVSEDTTNSYIYTQVIGELDEQFTVNIILANGDRLVLPNFAFN